MSAQDGKGFKQDMLVSIRYRNDLPPPPMPPKLLDIDTGGIQQYLDPSFASGLVRREEPNIDVDAEGGMPIDMIGMYGYFEGDESAIMAPEIQPALDPEDLALMLTPEQLRTGGVQNMGTSFLRKTQYMTNATGPTQDPLRSTQPKTRKQVDKKPVPVARDDKENIKRNIQKGFELAYPNPVQTSGSSITLAERTAWERPVHPDNSNLKPVEIFPILPDLDAVTDVGNLWSIARFDKPPLPAVRGRRDNRIDGAFFMAQPREDMMPEYEEAKKAYEQDPRNFEDPGIAPCSWSLLLPNSSEETNVIRTLFDQAHPDNANLDLIPGSADESTEVPARLPITRTRFYPYAKRDFLTDPTNPNPRFTALSLYEPSKATMHSRLRKQGPAAYYYPVLERVRLKADRGKVGRNSRRTVTADEDLLEGLPEQFMILPREPNAMELEARYTQRGTNDSHFANRFQQILKDSDAARAAQEAEQAIDEQSEHHEGAQDVSMADIEVAGEAEVARNGVAPDENEDD